MQLGKYKKAGAEQFSGYSTPTIDKEPFLLRNWDFRYGANCSWLKPFGDTPPVPLVGAQVPLPAEFADWKNSTAQLHIVTAPAIIIAPII